MLMPVHDADLIVSIGSMEEEKADEGTGTRGQASEIGPRLRQNGKGRYGRERTKAQTGRRPTRR
jgi:hypothetical protein